MGRREGPSAEMGTRFGVHFEKDKHIKLFLRTAYLITFAKADNFDRLLDEDDKLQCLYDCFTGSSSCCVLEVCGVLDRWEHFRNNRLI